MQNHQLKKIREKLGLSQADMAAKLNMSQSNYCKLEKDDSKLDKYRIIAILNEFGNEASTLLDADGVEIVLKNKRLSKEATINKTELDSFYNYSNELQGTISFQQKLIAELQKEKVALIKLIEEKLR